MLKNCSFIYLIRFSDDGLKTLLSYRSSYIFVLCSNDVNISAYRAQKDKSVREGINWQISGMKRS